jgi:iron complex outermembrane receptor protein
MAWARNKTREGVCMKHDIYKSALLLAAASLSCVGINQAAAQESDDIIVTARRIEERLQDVPISITTFNQAQLDDRNVTNAADLVAYTPSLQSNSQFGPNNASFAIRGFLQDNYTAPSVGVYLADALALNAGSSFTAGDGAGPGSFFDLQNVQVLRGPQGTLFGRNTTGGAILLVPQRPTDEFEGYLEGSVGNYEMQRIQGVLNIPMGDQARLRLGVDRMTREGFLDNIPVEGADFDGDGTIDPARRIGPEHFNDVDYIAGRLSFVVDLTPNLENYSIVTYARSDTNGFTQTQTDCRPDAQATFASIGVTIPTGQMACAQLERIQAADNFYAVENGAYGPRNIVDQWQFINTTTWDLTDNLTVKNIFSYGEIKMVNRQAVFGNFWIVPAYDPLTNNTNDHDDRFAGGLEVGPTYAGTPMSPFNAMSTNLPFSRQNTLTEELQFQGTGLDQRLTWQAGIYYSQSDPLQQRVGTGQFNFGQCTDITFDPDTGIPDVSTCALPYGFISAVTTETRRADYTDRAVYAQASYDVTDRLTATIGLRYTEDESHALSQRFAYSFYDFPSAFGLGNDNALRDPTLGSIGCGQDNGVLPAFSGGDPTIVSAYADANCTNFIEQNSSATTGLIDLEYRPTDNLMIYGKYSRGYRTGLVNPRGVPPIDQFSQETVDSYEVGLKASWRGAMPGMFNVSAFTNAFEDQQLNISFVNTSGGIDGGICSCGTSEISGVELDGAIALTDRFRLSGALGYLTTELTEFRETELPAGYTPIPGQGVGFPLPLSPEWSGNFTASYALPAPESLGEMTIAATYSYVDDFITRATAHAGVDSHHTVDLNFNWDHVAGGPVDLSVFGTNVTDEEYYTYSNDLYDTDYGFTSAVQGIPRMYGVRLRYGFGAAGH